MNDCSMPVKPMRIGMVVGEASGDILGAGLMRELKKRFPDCLFEGVGGPQMLEEGFQTLYAMERLAVIGLIEPLKRLPELLRMRRKLYQHFSSNPPDVFIGIDAPDFNLTLEEKLRQAGVATAHYVSPSVWAWRKGRVKKIARAVDLMLTLFPFEEAFYREHQVSVVCVGHTLADRLPMTTDTAAARARLGINCQENQRLVALLPGSRKSEVDFLCRLFFEAAEQCLQQIPELQFVIPAANEARKDQITAILTEFPTLPAHLILRQSHEVMAASDVVLMASGTTTLEAMLLKKPMVIAYKMAALSFAIIKRMATVKYVGLPNLLAPNQVVPELLQSDATADNIARELLLYLQRPEKTAELQSVFHDLHLSLKRNADQSAADAICSLIAAKQQI